VRRAASESGSKVITDPRQAGSDLLELLLKRLCVLFGHDLAIVAEDLESPASRGNVRGRGPAQKRRSPREFASS
jgi:hypothetical protein